MDLSTETRCAHCFGQVAEGAGRTHRGERLCAACFTVRVDGPTSPADPLAPADLATVSDAASPDPWDDLARHACSDAGVPLSAPADAAHPETRPHPLLHGKGNLVARLLSDIHHWCDGRWWHVRVPALLFFAFTWIRHAGDPMYQSVFKGLNLGVHELGHYVFGPFGDVIGAWGGSLLQCLVPLIAMGMFLKQRDYFAISFAWGWLGTNYFEVSTYVADAVRMQLPLVTPGGGHAIHDWNFILGARGWLRHTEAFAEVHRALGHACLLICLGSMSWILLKMVRSAARRHAESGGAARQRPAAR